LLTLVQGQLGQKGSKTTISKNKLGMVVYISNPSYSGGKCRMTLVQGFIQNLQNFIQNITKSDKELRDASSGRGLV
jgi:hypothetical protein